MIDFIKDKEVVDFLPHTRVFLFLSWLLHTCLYPLTGASSEDIIFCHGFKENVVLLNSNRVDCGDKWD